MVQVRMKVVSKTQKPGYTQLEDGSMPHQNTIEFEVVSTAEKTNPNFPYSFWSSGTKFPLMTINESAAASLELGKEYNINITPAE